jgi:hypothetical protein
VAFTRFQAELTNDASGSGNPAYVHFDFFDPPTVGDAFIASLILQFLGTGYPAALNTRINGITVQAGGVGTLVPVPFPTAQYAVRAAANTFITPMAAYGVAFGAGALAPAGSSETVSLYSTLLNRHGYGRLYLPFLGAPAVNSSGALDGAYVAGTAEAYLATFLATPGSTWTVSTLANPVVHSGTAGDNAVLAVKVSSVVANLHTRRK